MDEHEGEVGKYNVIEEHDSYNEFSDHHTASGMSPSNGDNSSNFVSAFNKDKNSKGVETPTMGTADKSIAQINRDVG